MRWPHARVFRSSAWFTITCTCFPPFVADVHHIERANNFGYSVMCADAYCHGFVLAVCWHGLDVHERSLNAKGLVTEWSRAAEFTHHMEARASEGFMLVSPAFVGCCRDNPSIHSETSTRLRRDVPVSWALCKCSTCAHTNNRIIYYGRVKPQPTEGVSPHNHSSQATTITS